MSTAIQRQQESLRKTCAQRLIWRIATYFGDDSAYGRSKVRGWLKRGGYAGPPWKDEQKAIAALNAAGKDMKGFQKQYAAARGFIPSSEGTLVTEGEVSAAQEDALSKLKKVTIILMQGEKMIMQEIKDGSRREIDGIPAHLLVALNVARGT